MLTIKHFFLCAMCLVASVVLSALPPDEKLITPPRQETGDPGISATRKISVQVLKPLGTIVGEWKGVGQPKRGSSVGAWTEKAQAVWNFRKESATLVVTFESGKPFASAIFSVAADDKSAQLLLTNADDQIIELTQTANASTEPQGNTWIFESAVAQFPQLRCTLRLISEIRMTILFEEKPTEKSSYRRLSEIGLTRAGAKLADGNTGERQCIVTGGLGTMKVSFDGKTYYVCCEGCRQAFDADPAGTIDAYRQRLTEKAK